MVASLSDSIIIKRPARKALTNYFKSLHRSVSLACGRAFSVEEDAQLLVGVLGLCESEPQSRMRAAPTETQETSVEIGATFSDVAFFDKETERGHLERFLAARASATGEILTLVSETEAPDFVCRRPNGALVGVEHTRIEYNPERTEILQSCGTYSGELDNFAIFWAAARGIAAKEAKRRKSHWKHPDATILVLDLPEGYRFEDWPADSSMANEFSDSGFMEVWISDHSSIEEFGEITAIGLYPSSIWGIQGQGYLWGVPYK